MISAIAHTAFWLLGVGTPKPNKGYTNQAALQTHLYYFVLTNSEQSRLRFFNSYSIYMSSSFHPMMFSPNLAAPQPLYALCVRVRLHSRRNVIVANHGVYLCYWGGGIYIDWTSQTRTAHIYNPKKPNVVAFGEIKLHLQNSFNS